MKEALYRWRRQLFDPLAFRWSRRELRRLMVDDDLDAVVAATEAYQGRGFYARIHAVQNHWEISELTRRVQQLAPKTVVEIGTHKGGTLFIWCRAIAAVEQVVSIDLPGGLYGGGYDRQRERLMQEFLYQRPGARLDCLRVDSHAPETLLTLERLLAGKAIDFLYIDGDHSYEGVRRDYEMYLPLVRNGGMVAFHDIVTRTPGHQVEKFWREIRSRHRHEELVANPDGNKGLGILYL